MKTAAPEKKSVKTLKGQLFGAVSMMLVAAIALGTSTYAWFINNSVAAVEEMNLTVSTSTSMLVALQKRNADGTLGGYTGYKSSITNDDIIGPDAQQGGWADFLKSTTTMTPASVSSFSLNSGTPSFFATDNHVTDGKLDQFTALLNLDTVDAGTVKAYGVGQGAVKRLNLKFLASNNVKVYLGQSALTDIANMISPKLIDTTTLTESTTPKKSEADAKNVIATAQAVEIRKALRVAVVSENTAFIETPANGPYNDKKTVVFQFDGGIAGTAGNNTDYQFVKNHYPDAITGTNPDAITSAADVLGKIDETAGKYAAVKTVDPANKNHVIATELLEATLPTAAGTGYLASVDADGAVTAPATTPAELFELTANEPREVKVYIWLEGTDNECLNSLSGFNFNLVVPFAAVPNT